MTDSDSQSSNSSQPEFTTSRLSALTDKLRSGELTLLAGRPGVGVTLLAMQIALEYGLHQGKSVHVFSNQGVLDRWVDRLAPMASSLDPFRILRGQLNDHEKASLAKAAQALNQAPIRLHGNSFTSPECLPAYILETLQESAAGSLVLIDYLQWHGREHHQNFARLVPVLREISKMAQSLGATVIVLSNLRRAVEMRGDKRPLLNDLPAGYRQADMVDNVWLLYRHYLYTSNAPLVARSEAQLICHNLASRDYVELDIILSCLADVAQTSS